MTVEVTELTKFNILNGYTFISGCRNSQPIMEFEDVESVTYDPNTGYHRLTFHDSTLAIEFHESDYLKIII